MKGLTQGQGREWDHVADNQVGERRRRARTTRTDFSGGRKLVNNLACG